MKINLALENLDLIKYQLQRASIKCSVIYFSTSEMFFQIPAKYSYEMTNLKCFYWTNKMLLLKCVFFKCLYSKSDNLMSDVTLSIDAMYMTLFLFYISFYIIIV